MPEKKFSFTDDKIQKLSPDSGKRYQVWDSRQPGLAILVTSNGSKSFKFRSWDSVRQKSGTLTIGTYPKISIAAARKIAAEHARNLAAGEDIWSQPQSQRSEPTLDQAFNTWLNNKAARGCSSWTMDKQRYDKHIKPRFGAKKVSDITSKQIQDWFLEFPKKTGLSTTSANRILIIIRTIYNQELRSYPNPCSGIRLYREESRERFLRPSELPSFFESLNKEQTPDYLRDFIYLALYTGARKSNLLAMRWSDIDFDLGQWVIPAAESKNRSKMALPLIAAALDILARRWKSNQKVMRPSVFVFPALNHKNTTGHMTDVRDAWSTLLNDAGIKDFRLHDLRRSLGSWQTITGASTAIVGKSLGHRSMQATQVYSRMHLTPVRESIEKAIAAMEIARDAPAKITSIQRLITDE